MNFIKIVSAVAVFFSVCSGYRYDNDIETLIKSKEYSLESVGVYIKSMESESILAVHNPEKKFISASVNKLVTGAAAYGILGMDYTFNTTVFFDSTLLRDSGVVYGNVYIRGGGDPGFTAERIWLFVKQLSHLGVKDIRKDLILDDTFFDKSKNGPGYGDDKSSRAYNAPVGALSASFNSVGVHVAPGDCPGSPIQVTPFPYVKDIKIVSTAKTISGKNSPGIKIETRLDDGKTVIFVYGGMKVDDKPRYVYRKTWEPSDNFGRVVFSKFEECGIKIHGKIRKGRVPETLTPVMNFDSYKLNRYINHMFKYSNNFTAEMVFKAIGAESSGAPGSWEEGSKAVKKWWESEGLPGRLKIVNGSGMGDANKISSRQIVSLLENVSTKKDYFIDYAGALSISGIDGTLKNRFKESPLKGIVRAKTGTLNNYGVSNLAGYLFLPDDTIIFSILVNNKEKGQFSHWTLQQEILEKIASLERNRDKKEKTPVIKKQQKTEQPAN